MALLPYSTKDSIRNIRIHMIGCLQLASDNGHTSIAFPAMGTGSLGYPAELVASEMFGCVERFKRDRPQTTLKMIKFVIYDKDIELFQYFKQIEMSGRSCSQVRIEMVGTEKSINMSKEHLDAKVHELLKLPVTDQSNISSASYVSPKPVDENDLACGGLTPTENNFSKDNTHSSALKTPPEESKEENGRRSSKDCHRKQRMYDRTFSLTKDAEYLKVFEIDDCMLRVYKGDILNVPIDCMVIAKEGNQQHYVDNIAATDVQVVGEACCLNRKKEQIGTCVIQAVFPSWFNYKPMTRSNFTKCADDLRKTTLNCLQLAENENCTCIAFSSLNSGKFDVPQEVCAVQYAEAIKMFTKERRSKNVKEIHFIDQNRNMVEIIQKTFQDVIHDGKHSPYNMNLYIERSSVDKSGGASVTDNDMKSPTRNTVLKTSIYIPSQQNLSKKDFAEYDKQVSYIQDRKTLKCFFPPGNVVEVYDADILSLSDVEAIVCSENKQGEAKGMIAQALLKVGGDPYSYAKMKEFYKYKNSGDIITTQGGKCGFQWVMHAIISRKCKQNVVPIVYRNVLLETRRKNISSLALPILGTGCEDMDVIDSARLLLSELIQFFNDSKNRQFTLHVHLVLNDKDIASSVKDVFKAHITKIKESHKSEVEPRTGQISVDMGHESHSKENETGDIKDDVKTKSDFSTVDSATKDEEVPQDCVICMDNITKPMKLICGHTFCSECIEGYFRVRKVCPTCGKVCGIITGDQPEGMMDIIKRREHLEGYKRYKTIAITYSFASGKQGTDHPNPGTPYKAITRTAFLPDNMEGREICALLKVAFERRLVFTIGTSRTTGKEGVITWNDIHHKTDFRPHTQFGYPDGTYLQRVREELEVKGVTMPDIDKDFIRKLDKDNFRQIIK
ncbi:uncharacterized protein LOC132717558 [Ruditapes philippinarum]|uniref:uncharacterized protein LOC132717558 n=1 Tax=Ruditapes philippinarum TaxID=129788 RepID=UPI00295A8EDE|nr:uncharacterized protein LOC132717558 [Ruditapes philippinarum]